MFGSTQKIGHSPLSFPPSQQISEKIENNEIGEGMEK
jgi:hypothetical protein